MTVYFYPTPKPVEGAPQGYRTDVRPFEDAGPGTQRTRLKPRTTDHYYQCVTAGCRFWCVDEDKLALHKARRKTHRVERRELDQYESLPERR